MNVTPPPSDRPSGQREVLRWLDEYGDDLLRYASSRVRDAATAEDLVQETFLAALKNHHQFAERAAAKTWLTAILRRKLADYYRRVHKEGGKSFREPPAREAEHPSESGDRADTPETGRKLSIFNGRGKWNGKVKAMPSRDDSAMEREEFR